MMDNSFFINEMKEILKDEFPQFLTSLNDRMYQGIRVNTLKTSVDFLKKEIDVFDQKTPFDDDTWYLDGERKLGRHPFHIAGLFYMQEPSASSVVNALDVQPGDYVLDMCAAPGGKSTQILTRLKNQGLLWSNEINSSRAVSLLSNLERWGAGNYILTNATPANLSDQLSGVFDKVLVDAPCSGASMFKKYPDTVYEYTQNATEACQIRQLNILDDACRCLKQDGTLVYSTCIYNLTENEMVIRQFLQNHPEFELVDTGLHCGRRGIELDGLDSSKVTRIMPMDKGEGHFIARMVKKGEQKSRVLKRLSFSKNKVVDDFLKEYGLSGLKYTVVRDNVYCSEEPLIDFNGKIIRQGILLGTIIKNRFEPHHHLFVSLLADKWTRDRIDLDDEQLKLFMSGNSVPVGGYHGYVQVCYHGVSFAFGKADGRQIKNHLPKGLRAMESNQLYD